MSNNIRENNTTNSNNAQSGIDVNTIYNLFESISRLRGIANRIKENFAARPKHRSNRPKRQKRPSPRPAMRSEAKRPKSERRKSPSKKPQVRPKRPNFNFQPVKLNFPRPKPIKLDLQPLKDLLAKLKSSFTSKSKSSKGSGGLGPLDILFKPFKFENAFKMPNPFKFQHAINPFKLNSAKKMPYPLKFDSTFKMPNHPSLQNRVFVKRTFLTNRLIVLKPPGMELKDETLEKKQVSTEPETINNVENIETIETIETIDNNESKKSDQVKIEETKAPRE